VLTASAARELEQCLAAGGIAVFPADTVYGLACDPLSARAVARLYALKGRSPDKPAAVMFFSLERALVALPELGPRTRAALGVLLPGALTALVPNPAHRFPLAGAGDPGTLGLRVPSLPPALGALGRLRVPLLQSSANSSGASDAMRLEDVAPAIRAGADLVLDGGQLPGVPSTVVDLRRYEDAGEWSVIRVGAVSAERVAAALAPR
jgi:L-threonylcarbamoyladenylate synthase